MTPASSASELGALAAPPNQTAVCNPSFSRTAANYRLQSLGCSRIIPITPSTDDRHLAIALLDKSDWWKLKRDAHPEARVLLSAVIDIDGQPLAVRGICVNPDVYTSNIRRRRTRPEGCMDETSCSWRVNPSYVATNLTQVDARIEVGINERRSVRHVFKVWARWALSVSIGHLSDPIANERGHLLNVERSFQWWR